MKTLHIYPTSRAIRAATLEAKEQDTLLPHMLRIDAFEMRCVRLGDRAMIDPLQRILLLREAADFSAFSSLNIDRKLVRFLAHSEGLFRFFEELAYEQVSFEQLMQADAYAEYDRHLAILALLRDRYRDLLDARGWIDRMFVPEWGQFDATYVDRFDRIDLHLEGYLSRYELELFRQVAERTQVVVHFITGPYVRKMMERFGEYGIELPDAARVAFDLGSGQQLHTEPVVSSAQVDVRAVGERLEQIPAALEAIDAMVRQGIAPDRIALIVPDETFKTFLMQYDRVGNFNFAMGYDYRSGRVYKSLDAMRRYLQGRDPIDRERLERYGIDPVQLDATVAAATDWNVERFLAWLDASGIVDTQTQRIEAVETMRERFGRLFGAWRLTGLEWMSLWLHALASLRLDDVRGGAITVMGALETRGVAFDGVVVVDFNDGIVPATTAKDLFLDTSVRRFAGLPTRQDREALQKHLYRRLIDASMQTQIIYATADHRLPSPFLYAFGWGEGTPESVATEWLYPGPYRRKVPTDPVVESFDATLQTWSPSRLKSWLSCRRHYYYRYQLRIPERASTEINEGEWIHRILEQVYREHDRFASVESLRTVLEQSIDRLLPEGDSMGAFYAGIWKEKLKPFVAREVERFTEGWRVVEREWTCTGDIGGLPFVGRIDRVDRRGETALLIDYKTGNLSEANRTKHLEKTVDFQMNIYRLLAQSHYDELALAFWPVLNAPDLVMAEALDEKEAVLLEQLSALRATTHWRAERTDNLSQCRYCPYTLLCERGEYIRPA